MTNENQSIISLQEATYDYLNAYTEYQRHKQFYKNDCDVYKAVLQTHFPLAEVTVTGTTITLNIPPIEPNQIQAQHENIKDLLDKLPLLSDDVKIVPGEDVSMFVILKIRKQEE